jgi:flagellar basal body-associated protein FliL
MREHPERPDHDGPLEQNPLQPARRGLKVWIFVIAAIVVVAVVAFALVRLATAGQNTPGPSSLGALVPVLASVRALL